MFIAMGCRPKSGVRLNILLKNYLANIDKI